MDKYAELVSQAHYAAGGINGGKPPTAEQARVGNYRKGRVRLHNLDIAIETAAGRPRTGKQDGKPWSVVMKAHYGEIVKTRGADGDPVDVFIGPVPESDRVWVINRRNADGSFDEHKCLLGFMSEEHAVNAFTGSYERGQSGLVDSPVSCSIEQLKWWLKYGNHKIPLEPSHLPYDGTNDMSDITWDSAANPQDTTVHQIIYALRGHEDSELLLDAVTVADILEDADAVLTLDALVIPFNRLELKMKQLQTIMKAAGESVAPVSYQITEPFKQRGTTQVAAVFELSDGQTVSIFFHNPDTTPNKLTPDDEMVSWKWLLNKKDVTIVVAPERGQDLNPREVSRRIMRLAEKNSARFQTANTARAERMATIDGLRKEVEEKQQRLDGLNAEIERLEAMPEVAELQPSTAEAAIRAAWESEPRDIRREYGLTVTFNGRTQHFIAVQMDVQNAKNQARGLKSVIHLINLKFAKMLSSDPAPSLIVNSYDLNGKDELATLGAPKLANDFFIEKWKRLGLPMPEGYVEVVPGTPEPAADPHYSDKILDLLVENHGWVREAEGYKSLRKVYGGGTVGDLNPSGSRVFNATFDERGRYLVLQVGFSDIFDIDAREKQPEVVAEEFNRRADEHAEKTAATSSAAPASVDPKALLDGIREFMSASQFNVIQSGLKGEEQGYFAEKITELHNTISTMPETYGQDGKGDQAIAYLHYFKGSGDWYITEKDMDGGVDQAFGLASPFGDDGEIGYISIRELAGAGVELDLHWAPKTLAEIRSAKSPEPDAQLKPEPQPEPAPELESESTSPEQVAAESAPANGGAEVDPQVAADRSYLGSVIAGEIDLLHPEVGTKLEEIYTRAEADSGLMELFERAAAAYTEFVVGKAKSVL